MAFEVGKREKIFVGVVGLVLSIAALHLLIFMQRHDDLATVKQEYVQLKQNLPKGSTPRDAQKVMAAYQSETQRRTEEYTSLYKALNVEFEQDVWLAPIMAFEAAGKKQPYAGEDVVARELTKDLKALVQFKNENPSIKLSFLGSELATGWHIPEALPQTIQRGTVNLSDLVKKIIEDNNMLGYLNNARVDTIRRLMNSYQTELVQLTDTPANLWVMLTAEAGDALYTLKMLAHIDLVLTDLARTGSSRYTLPDLLAALRIPLEPVECYHLHRQLQSLLAVVQLAKEAGVEGISRVKLEPHKKLAYNPNWPTMTTTPVGATPFPGAAAPETTSEEEQEGDYSYSYGSKAGAAPTPPGPPKPGVGVTGLAGFAPGEEAVADALPIEIDIVGANQSVGKCLYLIANSPRNFDIDQLAIGGMPVVREAGKILARARVACVTLSGLVQKP